MHDIKVFERNAFKKLGTPVAIWREFNAYVRFLRRMRNDPPDPTAIASRRMGIEGLQARSAEGHGSPFPQL
jgi:hypothetical protein